MLIEPIDEHAATAALPRRVEEARGLFAWGRAKLGSFRLCLAWAEFLFVFGMLPTIAIAANALSAIPIVFMAMLSSTVVFLSMTRSFHWRDLLPVDPTSEWRLFLKISGGFAATAAIGSLAFAPDRFMSAEAGVVPMLIAFPILTALPIELVYRALFLRRYGHLFRSPALALAVGAAANALAYYVISGTVTGALFGAIIGGAIGWFYLKTGQFMLGVLLHWVAALCIWIIGPGLAFL